MNVEEIVGFWNSGNGQKEKACTSLEKESSHSLLTLLNSNSRWPAAYDRNCYSCVVHTHAVYIIAASSWMKQTIRGWAYEQSREERRRNTHGSVFSRAFSIGNSYVHERMSAKQWPDNRDAHMSSDCNCAVESISTKRCV